MLLNPFLPLIGNKIKQAFGQIRFSDIAAVKELSINKGNRHFIFEFLCNFYWGILIHGWLLFQFSVLTTAGYDVLSAGATSL